MSWGKDFESSMRNKVAVIVGALVVAVFQDWDKATMLALSVVIFVTILIPARCFRWPGSVLVLLIATVMLGPVGCMTKNNVVTKSVIPGPWGTNITTYEDKSWSVNQLGSSSVNNHRNGNLLHFRAVVGGGAPVGGRYGYIVGPGGYGYNLGGNGYPMVAVPIESQQFHQEQTWRRYGFDGNGNGQGYHNGNSTTDSDVQKFYNLSGPGGSGPRGYGY